MVDRELQGDHAPPPRARPPAPACAAAGTNASASASTRRRRRSSAVCSHWIPSTWPQMLNGEVRSIWLDHRAVEEGRRAPGRSPGWRAASRRRRRTPRANSAAGSQGRSASSAGSKSARRPLDARARTAAPGQAARTWSSPPAPAAPRARADGRTAPATRRAAPRRSESLEFDCSAKSCTGRRPRRKRAGSRARGRPAAGGAGAGRQKKRPSTVGEVEGDRRGMRRRQLVPACRSTAAPARTGRRRSSSPGRRCRRSGCRRGTRPRPRRLAVRDPVGADRARVADVDHARVGDVDRHPERDQDDHREPEPARTEATGAGPRRHRATPIQSMRAEQVDERRVGERHRDADVAAVEESARSRTRAARAGRGGRSAAGGGSRRGRRGRSAPAGSTRRAR